MSTGWLVIGASSGFGRHLAGLLLERGDRVAATARSTASLDDLGGEHRERLWPVALDLADAASVRAAAAAAFDALGRVDVVVSNAGSGLVAAAEELTTGRSTSRCGPT